MLLLPTFLNYSSPQEMFSMAPFPLGMFLFSTPEAAAGGGGGVAIMCTKVQSPASNEFMKVRKVLIHSVISDCDPMDCSPPGPSVHGISQARILEWVAISFSRGSS